jgi:hypothetical protein
MGLSAHAEGRVVDVARCRRHFAPLRCQTEPEVDKDTAVSAQPSQKCNADRSNGPMEKASARLLARASLTMTFALGSPCRFTSPRW